MTTTYRRINAAAEAMKPLMSVRGLSGRTQIMLMRLWNDISVHIKTLQEADLALARSHGKVKEDGTIDFKDEASAADFLAEREKMFSAEADLNPILIQAEDALFFATTPETWASLDGFILIQD